MHCLFQEGPESISVWLLETRTTCAVEALNGVLGRGIASHPNFFNFVTYIKKFDLNRSIALRNMNDRCAVTKKRRFIKTDNCSNIREATRLLVSNIITVSDFLDKIVNFKWRTYNSNKKRPTETEQLEDSQSESDTEEPHSSQQQQAKKQKNICRLCDYNYINVLFLPCKHFLVCSECWNKFETDSIPNCIQCDKEVIEHIVAASD